jgi:hypothetical protein
VKSALSPTPKHGDHFKGARLAIEVMRRSEEVGIVQPAQ